MVLLKRAAPMGSRVVVQLSEGIVENLVSEDDHHIEIGNHIDLLAAMPRGHIQVGGLAPVVEIPAPPVEGIVG